MVNNDTDKKIEAGINKKSFEIYYNGGSIWCEHLDSMGPYADKVKEKFISDTKTFNRPSASAFMIINLDETELYDDITELIVDTIVNSEKKFMKIAIVGLKRSERAPFRKIQKLKGCAVSFFDDFEKAKEWNLP